MLEFFRAFVFLLVQFFLSIMENCEVTASGLDFSPALAYYNFVKFQVECALKGYMCCNVNIQCCANDTIYKVISSANICLSIERVLVQQFQFPPDSYILELVNMLLCTYMTQR